MPLTAAQKTTLKAHIDASNDLNVFPNNTDGNYEVARLLNLPASPAWTVYKSRVTQDEVMTNGMDWTRVDNLSIGKARIWEWMFKNQENAINPSKATVRAGIDATWVGTAADLAVRATVYGHCKRTASRVEKLFSSGTGSTADPAILGSLEGTISANDVEEARNS